MLGCWVVKRPGVIRKVWDDWWWSLIYIMFFPFFQTVSEKKHEWLAGFLSTCDSCNMWFFVWSSWCHHKATVNFHPKSAVFPSGHTRWAHCQDGQFFPKKKCKKRTEFFLGKKTNTAGWFFSVNFTVRQDLLIRRSLYLHPCFWTTQYGMVLQQILGIQQNLGKTSETWWADQILQVWKNFVMSWVTGRSGSQVVRRPTLHLDLGSYPDFWQGYCDLVWKRKVNLVFHGLKWL